MPMMNLTCSINLITFMNIHCINQVCSHFWLIYTYAAVTSFTYSTSQLEGISISKQCYLQMVVVTNLKVM